jgi:8-oxo-dGTP pyrophosphatase MutT (NUDIX family)
METHWTTLGRQPVYRGRTTIVDHTVELPDGSRSTYEVDESVPFAVAVLVIDDDRVLLTRQYRYPLDAWILDLPAGGGEPGEEPEHAARRELEEELGLVAVDLVPLHTFFVNPGRSAWPVHVFSCLATTTGTASLDDPSEQVRLVALRVVELDAAIRAGDIVDPTLLVARAMAGATGLLPPLAP